MVDASMLAPALTDDGAEGERHRDRLAKEDVAAPELIDLEIASALRKAIRTAGLGIDRAVQALAMLAEMEIERHSHVALLHRIWELRDNVSPYDAAYVALAEALGVTLLTADARLGRAPGPRCTIEILS